MAVVHPRPFLRNDRDLEDSDDEVPASVIGRGAFCASSFRGSLQLYEQAADHAQLSHALTGMPWQGASLDDLPEYQDVKNRDDSFPIPQGFANKVNFNDLPWEIINASDMEARSMDDLPQYQDVRVHNDLFPLKSSKVKTNHIPLGIIKTQRTQSFVSNIDLDDLPQERFNIQDEHTDGEGTGSFHTLPHNSSTGLDEVHIDDKPDSQEECDDDLLIARGSAILWMRARSSEPKGADEESDAQAASSLGPSPVPAPPPAPLDRSGYRRPSRHTAPRSNAFPKA